MRAGPEAERAVLFVVAFRLEVVFCLLLFFGLLGEGLLIGANLFFANAGDDGVFLACSGNTAGRLKRGAQAGWLGRVGLERLACGRINEQVGLARHFDNPAGWRLDRSDFPGWKLDPIHDIPSFQGHAFNDLAFGLGLLGPVL